MYFIDSNFACMAEDDTIASHRVAGMKYRSLNAILAQLKNCRLELTLRLNWKI
jgi:hypothetical protein